MFSFRDFIIFLAGMEFFHTLVHVMIKYFIPLPLPTQLIMLTHRLNFAAIVFNAVITVFLLCWAVRLNSKKV